MTVSNFYIKNWKILIFSLTTMFVLGGFSSPKSLDKKIKKEILKTFQVNNSQLDKVFIPNEIQQEVKIFDNLYKISSNHTHIGFAYVGNAKSKIARFDYLVLFNTEVNIVKTKVLVYREDHGGEIGSRRWLKQFIGLSVNSRAILGDNIDGISGATISVRAMTKDIDALLQSLQILKKHKLL